MTDQEPLISPGLPTAIGFDHDLDVVVVIGWSAETRSTQVVSWGSEQYREQAAQANCWLMEHWPRPVSPDSLRALVIEYIAAREALHDSYRREMDSFDADGALEAEVERLRTVENDLFARVCDAVSYAKA